MRAGSLRTFITILHQQEAPPGGWSTGKVGPWVPLFTDVPADPRHVSGLEAIRADAVTSTVRASFRIRYQEGITAAMRVQEGSDVYAIKAVLMDLGRRQYVDLVCELTK